MIREAIAQLVDGKTLSFETAQGAMLDIMEGVATSAQIGGFLTAMRLKGETTQEISACAKAMRMKCAGVHPPFDVLDIVGTGGDLVGTFNISTVSAFVIAAAGVKVAKHGNRSVSSKCGSADVLEAMGVKVDLSPEESERVLEETGICFLYAQSHHKGMRYASPVRRELGVRTLFNILGPLANPAQAKYQLLGVYDKKLVLPMAEVLGNLGVKRALVVHGNDGLDEVTLTDGTYYAMLADGKVSAHEFDPGVLGLSRCGLDALLGGAPDENAAIAYEVLGGAPSAKRDVVILNAAAGLYAAGAVGTIAEGYETAKTALESGAALRTFTRFQTAANAFRKE